MIYLASPYSDPDPSVREQRFQAACAAAAALMRDGHVVFSPVAHSHALTRYGLPPDWSFWERHDLAHLERCDEVIVLMLDGWEQSVGVQAELSHAAVLGKPVRYLDPGCVEGIANPNSSHVITVRTIREVNRNAGS